MDYFVTVDNEETSALADRLSLTGTVNGVQCAAVARLSQIKGKADKQRALIQAYLAKSEAPPKVGAERVSL